MKERRCCCHNGSELARSGILGTREDDATEAVVFEATGVTDNVVGAGGTPFVQLELEKVQLAFARLK